MRVVFNYHESDDSEASVYNMTFEETSELIQEHNEYFETNYQTIEEFNKSEPYREIEIKII